MWVVYDIAQYQHYLYLKNTKPQKHNSEVIKWTPEFRWIISISPWWTPAFGLQGSQSAAVFTLVSSAMGAGCLSFSGRKGTSGHRGDSHHRFRCGCKAAGCWNPQKRQVKSMVKYTQWLMIDVKFDRLVKFSSPNCPIQRLLLGSQFLRSSLRPCLPSSLLRLPFMLKTAGVEGKVVGNSDLTYNYIIS